MATFPPSPHAELPPEPEPSLSDLRALLRRTIDKTELAYLEAAKARDIADQTFAVVSAMKSTVQEIANRQLAAASAVTLPAPAMLERPLPAPPAVPLTKRWTAAAAGAAAGLLGGVVAGLLVSACR